METDRRQLMVFGQPEKRCLEQLTRAMGDAGIAGVLCADAHPGYSMPIGGVIAYPDHVSPTGVGFDIACGNMAVATDIRWNEIGPDLPKVMDEITTRISFGVGRTNREPLDDPNAVVEEIRYANVPFQRTLTKMAEEQLGTVGAGNHYVDLLVDDSSTVWVACHLGSRGFGYRTAKHFLAMGGGRDEMDSPPVLFEADSSAGQEYLEAMELAGLYAYAGREAVIRKVLEILGVSLPSYGGGSVVHNHHNFAWQETHEIDGVMQNVWVHRKGSTPAGPGQEGFVGANMFDASHLVIGRESETSRRALYSTVHGAGRVMGRREAAGKTKTSPVWHCTNRDCGLEVDWFDVRADQPKPSCENCGSKMIRWRKVTRVEPGRVDWDYWQAKVRTAGIVLRGGGADEAPPVYKDLESVLDAHEKLGTIQVNERLRPIGVAMAGPDVSDPYKD